MLSGDAGTPPSPADGGAARRSQASPADSSNGQAGQPAPGGPPSPPSVSLPTGGGAIRDIGEKFAVSAATGTASLAVPVATSPGRAGFGPSLSLDYDSGAGNSPFGLGWQVSVARHHPQDRQGAAALPRRPRPGHVHPQRRRGPRPGPRRNATGPGSRHPSTARARGDGSWSSATGPGSRARSPGSSAGATWALARRTGGPSPRATSRRSTAPRPRAASRTPPTRRACSAG